MSEVRIERPGEGVAVVRMDAPGRKNAFTGDSARELTVALREVGADESVAVCVLAGSEDAFCAGAHRDLLAGASRGEPECERDLRDVYEVFDVLRGLDCPVLAAVCGPAVGAGLNLVLASDVRVVAEDAYLRSMFVANGIHPGGGHLRMLTDQGGVQAATLFGALDVPVSGAEFAALGLAVKAVPATQVEQEVWELARRAARRPSLVRLIRRSIRTGQGISMAEAVSYEAREQLATLRRQEA